MDLRTARLRLDGLRAADAPTLFAYRADPRVSRFQGWCPASLTEAANFIARQQAQAFAQLGSWCQLALRREPETALIGDVGVHFVDADTLEFGITVAPAAQQRGLAAEAAQAVLALAFETLGRHRVYAEVDPRNLACVRLLERLGMRREALFREHWRDGDGWADTAIHAILDHEWRARQPDHA